MTTLQMACNTRFTPDLRLPGGAAEVERDGFSSHDYIARLREVIPIGQLRQSLEQELTGIRLLLGEYVNANYSDVSGVSADLDRAAHRLPIIKENTQRYLSRCTDLLTKAEALHTELSTLLERHEDLRKERRLELTTLAVLSSLRESSVQLQTIGNNGRLVESLLLERLASEAGWNQSVVQQLDSWTADGPLAARQGSEDAKPIAGRSPDIINELKNEVRLLSDALLDRCTKGLKHGIEKLLKSPVADPSTLNSVLHLLQAVFSLHQESTASTLLREVYTMPKLTQFEVSVRITNSTSPGARAEGEALTTFLRNVTAETEYAFGPLFELFKRLKITAGPNKLHRLIEGGLIFPILAMISEKFPSCFVPVFPEQFVQNYRMLHELLDKLLDEAGEDKDLFRRSPQFIKFEKKWNTQAFEAARLSAASSSLRTGFAWDTAITPTPTGEVYKVQASKVLMDVVSELLNKDRLIAKELPRTLRFLSEVYLVRFDQFLSRVIETEAKHNQWRSTDWLLEMSLTDLIRLSSSVASLEGPMGWALKAVASDDEKKRLCVRTLFEEFRKKLAGRLQECEALLISAAIAAVSKEISAIRGIPPLFRMTNRQIGSTPSRYVASVESLVENFEASFKGIAPDDRSKISKWMIAICDASCSEFALRLTEVINAVELQERALRRLQRSKPTAEEGPSAAEKITQQLALDLDRFRLFWQGKFLEELPALKGFMALESCTSLLKSCDNASNVKA